MRVRETISHEEIIIYGIHLEAKICTKICTLVVYKYENVNIIIFF